MNILSVNKFYWNKGGSEAVFFGEKELLENNGHTVIPFSMKSGNNLPSVYSEYFVENVDYDSRKLTDKLSAASKIIYSFDARNKIKLLLDANQIDIAHFHIFQHQISPSVFGPLRKRNIPIVLTLHDLKPMCPNYKMYVNGHTCEKCKGKRFYHCFLNSCTKGSRLNSLINTAEMYLHYALGYYQSVDKYIAVSHFFERKMIEFGFKREQISYIPNFIDIEEYPESPNDNNYVVYFGRLSYEKGVDTLIRAAQLCPDIPVVIIGTGPDEQMLKKIVEENNISNIEFTGYKQGSELKQLISNSSFTVLPSVVYENCPMGILESFALGKAVIGSAIGGIPELINPSVDGLTYTAGDSDGLAAQMQTLWENTNTRREMGREGRKKIAKDFTPKSHYTKLA
ncbi:MAG: glycosyltransferase family 1 protein, partial [Chloroflexota bacterium]